MTKEYRPWLMVFTYSLAHFIVDFACAFLFFSSMVEKPNWFVYALVYNFLAFALQMPLGLLADAYNRNYLLAILGSLLVASALELSQLALVATITMGIGNALFHIGGGVDILNISQEKSSALGIFVSPGALGLYLGTFFGKTRALSSYLVLLMLLLTAISILLSHKSQAGEYPLNAQFSLQDNLSKDRLLAAASLFFVVCLRSFVGLSLDFPWKSSGLWGLTLVLSVVAGKMLGGFAADKYSLLKTSAISLGVTSILFLFPTVPILGLVSLFLFNMTMPITLWAMSKIFPAAKGFSFGLLTFGLFLGYLPKYLGLGSNLAPWLFSLMALASLALLYLGTTRIRI